MISIVIFTLLALGMGLYNRYVPVKSIPCNHTGELDPNTIILDIRDYNNKGNDIDPKSVNIPYAYLRRFKSEISPGNIHVVASDRLELNLGLRFLIRKGFNVTSYEISECPCKGKGGLEHGV
ncbi:sulfurtransferase [Peribacillus saganii]|uniref:Sulfurtransferase n=1 Tax=Peribacillus saganii TaxID=2303992 RepID=A0A372LNL7_9BACI|nr:sulfurtransferase [Peribacillus saganii]RFU69254.1 sulfurtransferase [Peribacillus saganii]